MCDSSAGRRGRHPLFLHTSPPKKSSFLGSSRGFLWRRHITQNPMCTPHRPQREPRYRAKSRASEPRASEPWYTPQRRQRGSRYHIICKGSHALPLFTALASVTRLEKKSVDDFVGLVTPLHHICEGLGPHKTLGSDFRRAGRVPSPLWDPPIWTIPGVGPQRRSLVGRRIISSAW